MENFIKNVMISDSIANNVYFSTMHYYNNAVNWVENAHLYLSPTIALAANIKYNIFEFTLNLSINPIIVFNILIYANSHKNANANDFLDCIHAILQKINLETHCTDNNYNNFVNFKATKHIERNKNDIFLMEMALVIGMINKNFNKMLELSLEFVKLISDNTIKILSFITMSMMSHYAMLYYTTNDKTYSKNKWIDLIIDFYLNNLLTEHKIINYIEKKKFILMLINYRSYLTNSKNDDLLTHLRMEDIGHFYCNPLDISHKFIPGSTSDQLLLIVYDDLMITNDCYGNMSANSFVYAQTRNINIIGAFLSNLIYKNDKLYKSFYNMKIDKNVISSIVENISSIIEHTE